MTKRSWRDRHPLWAGIKQRHMEVYNLTQDAEVFTANAYYIPGEESTLVDVGSMPGIESELVSLDAIMLTHQHGDHIGELDTVLDAFPADLYAYRDHPRRTHEIDDGDSVTIGDTEFEVIYTPGHASDHVVFASDKVLFSGDVVVYNDSAFSDGSFGRTDRPGQSRERLIRSLETLLDRLPETVDTMYPGHGDSFSGDVNAVIERALERAERREPKYPE